MATSSPSPSELALAAPLKGTPVIDITVCGRKVSTSWVMESLAPKHMTGNPDLFNHIVPVSKQVVATWNGKGLQVHGIGSVITADLVLPNVHYVPDLCNNLVSVDQLTTDHDLVIEMAGTRCCITKMSDGSVVGRAHLTSDNKYEVDFLQIQQN